MNTTYRLPPTTSDERGSASPIALKRSWTKMSAPDTSAKTAATVPNGPRTHGVSRTPTVTVVCGPTSKYVWWTASPIVWPHYLVLLFVPIAIIRNSLGR